MAQNIKILSFPILFTIIFLVPAQGQDFTPFYPPFSKDGIIMENMAAGGFSAPQFSAIDLNGDGKEDLFVFDRAGNTISTFINYGDVGEIDYRYEDYSYLFPQLSEFALLRDYNGDGLQDIFTLSSAGLPAVEVWSNIGSAQVPSFEKVKFHQFANDILYFRTGSNYTNIYVSNIDLPEFVDLDGDGDLDLLTFEVEGSHLQWYRNTVVEQGLSKDTLVYVLEDRCYGLFYEDSFSEDIVLSENGEDCADGFDGGTIGLRHSGSSILAVDADKDGVLDICLGDLANRQVVMLYNGRDNTDAWMVEKDTEFPSYDVTLDINTFNAGFEVDVNNDGLKDLIFAPNFELGSDNDNHIWVYLNTGNTEQPYTLHQEDFLIDRSITMGGYSHPAFIDFNADGLMDLLVGSNGVYVDGVRKGGLYLYENVGTESSPAYELVDENYLDLQVLPEENGRLAPAAGDLDGDGDVDLLIGNTAGFYFYFENQAGAEEPVDFKNYVYPYQDLRPGSQVKPHLFDLNDDGLMDILSGERNDNIFEDVLGGVNYFENIGTPGLPEFNNDETAGNNTPVLGGIFTKDVGETATGESSPFFIKSDDKIYAVVGSRSGRVRLYDNITNNIYGLYNKALDSLPIKDPGNVSTVALEDIDNDEFYELVVGNERGGLNFYNTPWSTHNPISTEEVNQESILISPNPFVEHISVSFPKSIIIQKIELMNLNGELVRSESFSPLHQNHVQWSLQNLPSGVYIIKIYSETGVVSRRILKL